MTLAEKLALTVAKKTIKMAKENDAFDNYIQSLEKDTVAFLIQYELCTPGEIAKALMNK